MQTYLLSSFCVESESVHFQGVLRFPETASTCLKLEMQAASAIKNRLLQLACPKTYRGSVTTDQIFMQEPHFAINAEYQLNTQHW